MGVAHSNIAKLIAAPTHSEACINAYEEYKTCTGTACWACVTDAVKDLPETPTCNDLKVGDFCKDMNGCIADACSKWACEESLAGMAEACEAEVDNTEPLDCPGLCGWGPASYLRQG